MALIQWVASPPNQRYSFLTRMSREQRMEEPRRAQMPNSAEDSLLNTESNRFNDPLSERVDKDTYL